MSEIMRWDQAVDRCSLDPEEALPRLLAAVVDAAVLIPESEACRALTWTVSKEILKRSIDDGRVRRFRRRTCSADRLMLVRD